MNEETISKALISFLYEVDYNIISCKKYKNYYTCFYINISNEIIDSKVRFTKSGVEWGNLNGRWRNDEKDAKITYKIYGNEIKFTKEYISGNKLCKKIKT